MQMTVESSLFHPDVLTSLRAAPEIFSSIAQFKGKELGLQKMLRSNYDNHIVRAALILHDLRKRGAAKFSKANQMWFDRTGLEQSTSEPVANYKAKRFSGDVVDICSGIGGDSIAIAANANVTSIDRVSARSQCLMWNAEAYGVANSIDAHPREAVPDDASGKLVHIDPDRRAGPRGRSLRIEDLEPGPAFLKQLMQTARGGAIKLSSASNFRGSFDDCEVELISHAGECKEATVWFGELKTDCTTRATCVATGETIAGHLSYDMAEVAAPGKYVFDPDPALVRSGLLDQFCLERSICRLDVEEEYLTADEVPKTAFLPGVFEITGEFPNDGKALRKHLRELNVGRVEIKSRRVPTDVEKLRRSLKLKGTEPATILIARLNGLARVLVGRRQTGS
jgi:methylglyoxal synthase